MNGVALHYFVKVKYSSSPFLTKNSSTFFFCFLPLDSFAVLNRYSLTGRIESINFMKRKLMQKKKRKNKI